MGSGGVFRLGKVWLYEYYRDFRKEQMMRDIEWVFQFSNLEVILPLGRPDRMALLRELNIRAYIDDFEIDLKGTYFCSGCAGQVTRSPLESGTSRNGVPAYFKHGSNQAATFCPYYVKSSDGTKFLTESDKEKFIDSDGLVVCPKWSTTTDEGVVDGEIDNPYAGISEDDWGNTFGNNIGRHNRGRISVANRITSVRCIARDPEAYRVMAISFPGEDEARKVNDILKNLHSSEHPPSKIPMLYFGKISSIGYGNKRHFIHINTDWGKISIFPWIKDFESRRVEIGRAILVYGSLNNSKQIYIDNLGQMDLIPVNKEAEFGLE
jgi:hypothetical protein